MKLKVDHAQRTPNVQSHELEQNELYRFGSNKVMLLSNIYLMLYQKHNLIAKCDVKRRRSNHNVN